ADFRFMASGQPVLFLPAVREQDLPRDALLAGQIPVFDVLAAWRDDADFWHTDPISGAVWPRQGAVDHRPGNPVGDVRTVWELNRLQHLFELASIAAREPALAADAGAVVVRQLDSWRRANPYPHGVNHRSAMEHG